MLIRFDCDKDAQGNIIAYHVFDTNQAPQIAAPESSTPAVKMNGLQFLAWLQQFKGNLAAHGYNMPTSLPGYAPGTTRWQVIVSEASKGTADASVKALNLT